jgi:hypothetical protein
MTSTTSIASDRGNYLTDKELNNEAVLEEMESREEMIGNGVHRQEDGLGKLAGMGGMMEGQEGGVLSPRPQVHAQHVAPQQMTAEELMFGDADGVAGKGGMKKSSKQRFEERQVG